MVEYDLHSKIMKSVGFALFIIIVSMFARYFISPFYPKLATIVVNNIETFATILLALSTGITGIGLIKFIEKIKDRFLY